MAIAKDPYPVEVKNTRIAISDDIGKQSWICQGKKISKAQVPFRGAQLDLEKIEFEALAKPKYRY